jgi:hypothetical protein
MRFFIVIGVFICAGGYLEKEEFVSMNGGSEENARGKQGARGSPDTSSVEEPVIKNLRNWAKKFGV